MAVPCGTTTICGISTNFFVLFPSPRQVTHALLTRPPLALRKASSPLRPFDLHVLGTPPAFVLSQDQTLDKFHLSSSFLALFLLVLVCVCCFGNFFPSQFLQVFFLFLKNLLARFS